jgi:hypothetical protein
MNEHMQRTGKCGKDIGMPMPLAKESEAMDISTREKGGMLYELEAEEIDLKDLGANA